MSIQKIGVRYERLLILAAPISFACILVAFIAVASEAVTDKKNADCYDSAALLVEKNMQDLETKWKQREKIGKVEFANEYVSALAKYMIYGLGSRCEYKIGTQDTNKAIPPKEFAEKLKLEARKIRQESAKKPVRSYGIEMPEKVKIEFFGVGITINVLTLAQVLQLTLAPILILWLGSLFNTRYRETILIESAASISELYPHCINLYLNGKISELRKRSKLGYYLKIAIPYMPTVFRILLLSIFVVPPTVLYCAGLFYLGSEDYIVLSVTAGFLVVCFTFINLVSEMNPWHSGKTFPGPKYFEKR
jgi:hypothetical protein